MVKRFIHSLADISCCSELKRMEKEYERQEGKEEKEERG
jgi:hypothetical protein